MCTYKRKQSIPNISNLITYLGTYLAKVDLADLLDA